MPKVIRYRALVGMHYPSTPEDVQKHLAKEECDWTEVVPGEECIGLPPESVPWLLEQECIEAIEGGDNK